MGNTQNGGWGEDWEMGNGKGEREIGDLGVWGRGMGIGEWGVVIEEWGGGRSGEWGKKGSRLL